jgi:hypothetical protein
VQQSVAFPTRVRAGFQLASVRSTRCISPPSGISRSTSHSAMVVPEGPRHYFARRPLADYAAGEEGSTGGGGGPPRGGGPNPSHRPPQPRLSRSVRPHPRDLRAVPPQIAPCGNSPRGALYVGHVEVGASALAAGASRNDSNAASGSM